MTSTIKVNNIQNQCGANIINENSNTITLGASGDTIALASGASQTGFGRTGTVDWDTTPKTATFTAVSGDGFFANTTGSAFNMNLPAGSAGAIVSVADYAGTWQNNALTVLPNGSDKIGGVNANVILNTQGQSVTFVFVDSTQGWINTMDSTSNERGSAFIAATGGTITNSGNCRIHTFTSPGTFSVCAIANCAANNIVSYVVVAGGGGGASGYQTGGAGAGGFREFKSSTTPYSASPLDGNGSGGTAITVTTTSFPITVGAGGAKGPSSPSCGAKGSSGSNSTFSTVTSTGGGGSGAFNPSSPVAAGLPGGSGGGAGRTSGSNSAGSGNTPSVSPAQGKDGGNANTPYAHPYAGGGGGGATVAGGISSSSTVGDGGNGATTSISGSPTTYAGGGGGGGYSSPAPSSGPNDSGEGGSGGGGKGGYGGPGQPTACGNAGSVNTGGGGGGSSYDGQCGGAGGSGVVIIRYKFQ